MENNGEFYLGPGSGRFTDRNGTQDLSARGQLQPYRQEVPWEQHVGIQTPDLEAAAWAEILRECNAIVDGYQGEVKGLARPMRDEKADIEKLLSGIPTETTVSATPILKTALRRKSLVTQRSVECQTELSKFFLDIYIHDRRKFSEALRELAFRLQTLVHQIKALSP